MNGMILTDKGRSLAIEAFLGKKLAFTKAEIGEGKLTTTDNPKTFTELKSKFKEIGIHSSSRVGDSSFRVRTSFTNEDFDRLINYREVGIYAKVDDGEEFLYSYRNAGDNAEPIPSFDGLNRIERVVDIINYVGDADNVTIEAPSGVYVLAVDFEEIKTQLQAIMGTSIAGYLQDFTTVYGGTAYMDKITKKLFLPANLEDGEERKGKWDSANSDWKEFLVDSTLDKDLFDWQPLKLMPGFTTDNNFNRAEYCIIGKAVMFKGKIYSKKFKQGVKIFELNHGLLPITSNSKGKDNTYILNGTFVTSVLDFNTWIPISGIAGFYS